MCTILEHIHLDELNFHQELIRRFLKSRSVSSVYSHTTLNMLNFIRSVSYASFKISSSQHNYFDIYPCYTKSLFIHESESVSPSVMSDSLQPHGL